MNQLNHTEDGNKIDVQNTVRSAYPTAIPLAEAFIARNQLDIESLPAAQPQRELSILQKALDDEEYVGGVSDDLEIQESNDDKFFEPFYNAEPVERFVAKETIQPTFDDAEALREGLIKSPRAETNQGVDPNSRKYIRGVLHRDSASVMASAFGYILCFGLVGLSFAPLPLILLDKEKFFWVVFSPALLLPAFFVYILMVLNGSCPVCRQKQFVPKACHKHVKAHHWVLFGYRLPTAFHMIFYKWFRCIFCGTSVRLKE